MKVFKKLPDLLLCSILGDLELRRLNWQKIWKLSAPIKEAKISAISWKPDGKSIAVGYNSYSSGRVVIVNVEDHTKTRSLDLEYPVTCLNWLERTGLPSQNPYKDESSKFFLKLPSLPRKNEQFEDQSCDTESANFNILAIGTEDGTLLFFAHGILEILRSNTINPGWSIVGIQASESFKTFTVFSQSGTDSKITSFDTSVLENYSLEIQTLAQHYSKLLNLNKYASDCLKSLEESWEDSLVEFDNKIDNLAKSLPKDTSLASDMLELLLFGVCSIYTQSFLIHQLTEKGLTRLKQAIESSYSNMEGIASVNLFTAGQQLVYQCCLLLTLAKRREIFGLLGLEYNPALYAVRSVGRFMTKSNEMLEVISLVMKQLEAFFRWLHLSIYCLNEEPVPADMEPLNMEEIQAVASFIHDNFGTQMDAACSECEDGEMDDIEPSVKNLRLEKVGQYLRDENLVTKLEIEETVIENILTDNPELMKVPGFFLHNKDSSLLQEQKNVTKAIEKAFSGISRQITQSVQLSESFQIKSANVVVHISLPNDQGVAIATYSNDYPGFAYYELVNKNGVYILSSGLFRFQTLAIEGKGHLRANIVDLEFYTNEILSLVLNDSEDETTIYSQISCRSLRNHLTMSKMITFSDERKTIIIEEQEVDIKCFDSSAISISFRVIDKFQTSKFAISSNRKIAAFAGPCSKVIKLYEMEVDEEDLNESSIREDFEMSSVES
ncbi:anaphase-promoting complex subunit 4-like isoform X2 [Artemia franciscana]|uniref:anaphase-promoting complex subunit 4-like isoform X2 n=1 Tax=Artemia franciscana TaxID=6661 RepID=UPI0032DBC64D